MRNFEIINGRIQALVIQAKGMEAANQSWVQRGQEPEYDQHAFYAISDDINKLLDDWENNYNHD